MADENNLGGKISLDITDFKANISALNREIKVIESGFKATAAGLGEWGASADGLQSRITALTGVIDAQGKKVQNLQEIYQKIVAEKGEESKAAQDLKIKINNETAALNKNKLELENTTKALNNFGKETKDADDKTGNFANTLKSIGGGIVKTAAIGIAAIGTAAAGAAVSAFKLAEKASDLSESQNVVKETFKGSSDEIIKWTESVSQSAGISKSNATEFVGSMGAMLKSSGLTEQAAGTMSTSLVQLTGDMSSFYNLSHDEAWEKIRSGISGETEPLKQLGINMSVANLEAYAMAQGINKAYSEMSQAEQTTLRYNYLLSVTKDAQGDFGRTLETSFSNQIRVAKMNLEEMATSIGQQFLPAFLNITKSINEGFTTGDWTSVGTTLSTQISNILNQITSQFPAILTLASSLITGLANGLTAALPNILPTVVKIIIDLVGMLTKILQENGPKLITAGIEALTSLVNGILQAIPKLIPVAMTLIVTLVNGILENLPKLIPAAIEAIIAIVNGLMDALPKLIPAAIKAIVTIVDGLIGALPKLIEAVPEIVQTIVDVIVENLPLLIDAAIDIILELSTAMVKNLPLIITATIKIITSIVSGLVENIPTILKTIPKIFTEMVKAFKEIDWSQIGVDIIKGITGGLSSMAKSLANSVANVGKSALNAAKKTLGINSPSKVFRDQVGLQIGAGMAEGISDSVKMVNKAMSGLNNKLSSGIDANLTNTKTLNPARSFGENVSGNMITFEAPIYLDGKMITKATSKIQLQNNLGKARALGVVAG